ncbi:hypothetical protein F5Y19DRAFT_270078 [Xylariaceae sp. FL1651]|nr:hypothetical protein F5Y19DRAFT_270078 [Xylariaceae sp. FL1651]
MSSGSGNSAAVETVGSLLAVIANLLQDALRTLMFADKRAWGPFEFEQVRLLEDALDEAKKDFQELPALLTRRGYYENDRNGDSLDELHELCARFEPLAQNLKAWVRAGGPIEPEWARETRWLRRELHRAQCRAVRRIHDDLETTATRPRCLGALLVWRSQQQQAQQTHQPQLQSQHHLQGGAPTTTQPSIPNGEILACNSTGVFQRLGPGNRDIAFVCDFCDGFLVWEDLRSMPSTRQRAVSSAASMVENWAATGFTHSRSHLHLHAQTHLPPSAQDSDLELGATTRTSASENNSGGTEEALEQQIDLEGAQGEEKTILFPAVAIANHLPPEPGEWQAPLLCPLCDEYYYEEQGDGDMDRVRYMQDDHGFESVAKLQEHLEWSHTSLIPSIADVAPKSSSCGVM